VTIAKRPSRGGGTAGDIEVIWGVDEAKNFRKQDWTAKISLISFDKFRFVRRRRLRPLHPFSDPVLRKTYLVIRCLVGVTAEGAASEIENVSQVFQPDGRFAASNSP
jgi:hypothetical protein